MQAGSSRSWGTPAQTRPRGPLLPRGPSSFPLGHLVRMRLRFPRPLGESASGAEEGAPVTVEAPSLPGTPTVTSPGTPPPQQPGRKRGSGRPLGTS